MSHTLKSDAGADFPCRGSLPRLGSMPSFQNFNPFHRRRVHPSTAPAKSDQLRNNLESQRYGQCHGADQKSPTTTDQHKSQRQLTEVNVDLPGDSSVLARESGGDGVKMSRNSTTQSLPRSRTFSNLPLPTRLLTTPGQTSASKSQVHFESPSLTGYPTESSSTITQLGGQHTKLNQSFDHKHPGQSYRVGSQHQSFALQQTSAPVQAMQRWNSQPLLSNATNLRLPHKEIKQTRLLSVRQAPTPPISHAVLAPTQFTNVDGIERASQSKRNIFLRKPAIRRDSAVADFGPQSPPQEDHGAIISLPRSEVARDQARITEAEPLAYWTGRFSALADRMCNRELEQQLNPDPSSWKQKVSKTNASLKTWQASRIEDLYSSEATLTRTKHALYQLHSLCATEAARQSFRAWLVQFESSMKEPTISVLVETLTAMSTQKGCLGQDKENQLALGETACGDAHSTHHRPKLVSRWLGKGRK